MFSTKQNNYVKKEVVDYKLERCVGQRWIKQSGVYYSIEHCLGERRITGTTLRILKRPTAVEVHNGFKKLNQRCPGQRWVTKKCKHLSKFPKAYQIENQMDWWTKLEHENLVILFLYVPLDLSTSQMIIFCPLLK